MDLGIIPNLERNQMQFQRERPLPLIGASVPNKIEVSFGTHLKGMASATDKGANLDITKHESGNSEATSKLGPAVQNICITWFFPHAFSRQQKLNKKRFPRRPLGEDGRLRGFQSESREARGRLESLEVLR